MRGALIIMTLTMTLTALASPSVGAAYRAPQPVFETGRISRNAVRITARAKEGFHFNKDAPQSILAGKSRLKPTELEQSRVSFDLPSRSKTSLSFTLYLCDDAKSFCEKQSIEAEWTGEALVLLSRPAASASTSADASASARNALELARREQKPLLIDFFGIWCPPCNRLDSEVFNQPEFERVAGDFVRLKLDADDPGSWELKSRYRVGGYPTVVFANSQAEEISRIVGFRPLAEFVAEMKKAYALRNTAASALAARAAQGDREAADRLGLMHLERREYAEAERWLTGTRAHREQWHAAVIGARAGALGVGSTESAKSAESAALIMAYEKAIAEFSKTPDSIERRSALAAILKKAGNSARSQALLQEAIVAARELIAHPERLRGYEMTPADLWATMADIQESQGLSAESQGSWKKAAAEYERVKPTAHDRGNNLELAYSLYKSGDFKRASKIYRTLEKAYPQEFTFYFAHARMELERRALKPARELAGLAHDRSYGDNRLRAAHLLAQIESESGARPDAIALLDRTLQETALPLDPTIRTHRYVNQLRELRAKLAQAAP